jgi:L-lactate dehydrogenase complex protein LldG
MNDSRERILGRIRQSLHVTHTLLAEQGTAYPPPHPREPLMPTDKSVVEQFDAELSALHAHVHVCDGPAAALQQIQELLETTEAHEVLTWELDEISLPGLAELLERQGIRQANRQVLAADDRYAQLQELERIPVGISGVDAAIAETGTMIVVSGPGRGRLASLLPPVHIAILPADRIVRTMAEAFDLLRSHYGNGLFRDRSNVAFITGPSRTADIELSLTLGVHGPKEVHAIVVR